MPEIENRIWCMQLRCRRLLACARCKLWWMTPSWGTKAGDLPPETQFVLAELAEGGPYAVLLPLIDQDTYRATLRPSTRCSLEGAFLSETMMKALPSSENAGPQQRPSWQPPTEQ